MTNKLLVGGDFNRQDGRKSKVVDQLSQKLGWPTINGGNLSLLDMIDFKKVDTLVWMPNVSNIEEKVLPNIKAINPKMLLISSKRVSPKKYTDGDFIGRLLQSHSNLGIRITDSNEGLGVNYPIYRFTLMDPLGNQWEKTHYLEDFAKALNDRVDRLLKMTRIGSVHDPRLDDPVLDTDIEPEFVAIIQEYGKRFAKYVNAVNPNRLLGNAATRCSHGFPAVRMNDDQYLITRRNVDKETLTYKDFVRVTNKEESVIYGGEHKPSVDAPIQIRLFNYYHKVRYMIHGHVYLHRAKMTKEKIPCGYIDEFDEIKKLVSKDHANFVVNLRGHGCIIFADNLPFLREQRNMLTERSFPES